MSNSEAKALWIPIDTDLPEEVIARATKEALSAGWVSTASSGRMTDIVGWPKDIRAKEVLVLFLCTPEGESARKLAEAGSVEATFVGWRNAEGVVSVRGFQLRPKAATIETINSARAKHGLPPAPSMVALDLATMAIVERVGCGPVPPPSQDLTDLALGVVVGPNTLWPASPDLFDAVVSLTPEERDRIARAEVRITHQEILGGDPGKLSSTVLTRVARAAADLGGRGARVLLAKHDSVTGMSHTISLIHVPPPPAVEVQQHEAAIVKALDVAAEAFRAQRAAPGKLIAVLTPASVAQIWDACTLARWTTEEWQDELDSLSRQSPNAHAPPGIVVLTEKDPPHYSWRHHSEPAISPPSIDKPWPADCRRGIEGTRSHARTQVRLDGKRLERCVAASPETGHVLVMPAPVSRTAPMRTVRGHLVLELYEGKVELEEMKP